MPRPDGGYLIDDCSTDQTIFLKHYAAPYRYKYLRSKTNLGRSGAKNLGIREAKGEIIIFLDGEVMVAPDFVSNHLRHYNTEEKIAVCGDTGHHNIFSVLCPGFSREQIKRLHALVRKKPLLFKHLRKRLWLADECLHDFNFFWQHLTTPATGPANCQRSAYRAA